MKTKSRKKLIALLSMIGLAVYSYGNKLNAKPAEDSTLWINNVSTAASAVSNAVTAAKTTLMEAHEQAMLRIQEINALLIELKGAFGVYDGVKIYKEYLAKKKEWKDNMTAFKEQIENIKSFNDTKGMFSFDLSTLEQEMEKYEESMEQKFTLTEDLIKKGISKSAAAGEFFEEKAPERLKEIGEAASTAKGTNSILEVGNALLVEINKSQTHSGGAAVQYYQAALDELSKKEEEAKNLAIFVKVAGTPDGVEAAVKDGKLTQPLPVYWR